MISTNGDHVRDFAHLSRPRDVAEHANGDLLVANHGGYLAQLSLLRRDGVKIVRVRLESQDTNQPCAVAALPDGRVVVRDGGDGGDGSEIQVPPGLLSRYR